MRSLPRWVKWVLVGIAFGTSLAVAGCGDSTEDGAGGVDSSATTESTVTTSEQASSTTTTSTQVSTSASTATSTEPTVSTGSTIDVYFSSGDGSDCEAVQPFPRTLAADADPYLGAFQELVAGPSATETEAGAGSFFSPQTASVIRSVTLNEGLLTVDFSDLRSLIPNASASCGSAALLAQLNSTAFQFTAVERTRYLIEGSCDDFGNWLQRECFDTNRSGEQVDVATAERASGSGCTPPEADSLPAGRWFGFVDWPGIAAGSEAAEPELLPFDLACWFTGTAAIAAADEDGAESPPPNDYYIRNDSDRLRRLTLVTDAEATWLTNPGDPQSTEVGPYATWLAERTAVDSELLASHPGIWLTVDGDGQVTHIEEQYVP
ncbi:MAG: GerMN domain-containing protein [Acidimicrobiales bacterium]